ncbi:hypothetical protein V8F20_012684 [Naviculisporaceae sp. PSN 640]
MEDSGNSNPPTGNSGPRRGYSTVGPNYNPIGRSPNRRPGLEALDLTSSQSSSSLSLAPSPASLSQPFSPSFPTGAPSSSIPQSTTTQADHSLRALPQGLPDRYRHLLGMTREEACQWEINERNQCLAGVRTWIMQTQALVQREIQSTNNGFLRGLHASMTRLIATLPDLDGQESIAEICIREDRLRPTRPVDVQNPERRPPTSSPTLRPSHAESFATPSDAQFASSPNTTGGTASNVGVSAVQSGPLDQLLQQLRVLLIAKNASPSLTGSRSVTPSSGGTENTANFAPNTGGGGTSTYTPSGAVINERPQQAGDGDQARDGDRTPRAQTPHRTGHSYHASSSQVAVPNNEPDRFDWLSNDSNGNHQTRESRDTNTTASQASNPPATSEAETETATISTPPHNDGSSITNSSAEDSSSYKGFYQGNDFPLGRPAGASSSTNPPTQPVRQPQGPSATDNTWTPDRSTTGGGGQRDQGSFRGLGHSRFRGRGNHHNTNRQPVRAAHPDRPDEPIDFRSGQRQQQPQQAERSVWGPTSARSNDNGSWGSAPQNDAWGHGQGQGQEQGQTQGHAQGESESSAWSQGQTDWDGDKAKSPYKSDYDW